MGDAQIKVIVKYGAQNINVEVPATGKVEDLMQQLQLHTQLLPRLQKLICKGTTMLWEFFSIGMEIFFLLGCLVGLMEGNPPLFAAKLVTLYLRNPYMVVEKPFAGKVLKGDMSLKTAQLTDGAKVMLMAAQGFQPRVPTVCPSSPPCCISFS